MKKVITFVYLSFLMFVGISYVHASPCDNSNTMCISCNYAYNYLFKYNFQYVVQADGKGSATFLEKPDNYRGYGNSIRFQLTISDFINPDGEELYCPTVYSKNGTLNNEINADISITPSDTQVNLVSEEKNDKPFITNPDVNSYRCTIPKSGSMPEITAVFDGEIASYEANNPKYKIDTSLIKIPDAEIFANGCNFKLFIHCDDVSKVCFLSSQKFLDYTEVGGKKESSNENEGTGSGNNNQQGFNPGNICDGDNCDITLSNICLEPNVARTLKFVGLLLFILKIFFPTIIIVMGIVNLFQIITSGKDDQVKKSTQTIIRRMIIGVAIYLLPGFLQFVYVTANDIIGTEGVNNFGNCVGCLFDPNDSESCKIDVSK